MAYGMYSADKRERAKEAEERKLAEQGHRQWAQSMLEALTNQSKPDSEPYPDFVPGTPPQPKPYVKVGGNDQTKDDNEGSSGSSNSSAQSFSSQYTFNPDAVMSKDQIIQLAQSVGFSPDASKIVYGIAGGESGYNPTESTKRPRENGQNLWERDGEDSVGIMQINWGAHQGKKFLTDLGITKREHLFDPVNNMKAAKALYDGRGGGFQDWTVYNEGIYTKFM